MTDAVDRVVATVEDVARDLRTGIATRRGAAGEVNPSGERPTAADRYADDLLTEALTALDAVGWVASEEREGPVEAGDGSLAVTIDPLDGSSNVASNNLVGTVFGVFDGPLPAGGDDLLAAGYVLYGPATTAVVARDGRVTETLVTADGAETLDDDVRMPADPAVYSFGGRVPDWTDPFRAFADEVRADESMKLRYGGAMVGDVNQVLAYGGVFSYPALRSAPDGKLRSQFEAVPVAAVVEAADGASSDGERSLLAGAPATLHERTPVHLGDDELVGRLERALSTAGS
jgi:fructose-1,6-bisphosphatase I